MNRTPLLKSVWLGNVEIVKELLELPNILLDCPDTQGRTPLHAAAWGKYGGRILRKSSDIGEDSPELVDLLLTKGLDPNAPDENGMSPLSIACGTGATGCIQLLIDGGADINQTDKDGVTPLHMCFYRGQIDAYKMLIKYKPLTNIKNKIGKTAFKCLFDDDKDHML